MGWSLVLVVALLVLPLLWLGLRYRRFARQLASTSERPRLLAFLGSRHPMERYVRDAWIILDTLLRHSGRALTFKAFGACLGFALVYAFSALFIAWGMGGFVVLGDVALLPDMSFQERRLWATVTMVALGLVLALAVWGERADAMVLDLVASRLGLVRHGSKTFSVFRLILGLSLPIGLIAAGAHSGSLGFFEFIVAAAFTVLAILLVGAGALAILAGVVGLAVVALSGVGGNSIALAAAIVGVTVAALTAAIAKIGASAAGRVITSLRNVAVAGLGVGIVAIAHHLVTASPVNDSTPWLSFGLFYVVLPGSIAACHWVCWAINRRLAAVTVRHLHAKPQTHLDLYLLATCLGFLFLTALGTVAALAALIPRAAHFYDEIVGSAGFYGSGLSLDPAVMICRAVLDPLGSGIWPLLLVLSGALPCLIHTTILLASPIHAWISDRGWIVRLAHAVDETRPLSLGVLAMVMAVRRPLSIMLGLLLAVLLAYLCMVGIQSVLGVRLGTMLADLAMPTGTATCH